MRFFEGRRESAFFVLCRKEERSFLCVKTGEPGTKTAIGAASSGTASTGSRMIVLDSELGIGQL